MQVAAFDFDLPPDAIATRPASPRDASRLLHISAAGFGDKYVRDLPDCLRAGDLLVFNDTKVIPARLFALRGQARIELTLHKSHSDSLTRWEAFARPAKRLVPGDTIYIGEGFSAKVEEKYPDGRVLLKFLLPDNQDIFPLLARFGQMPLPPYIAKKRAEDVQDHADYQTVFAAHPGAVAAPTAGLHFTDSLLEALTRKGITQARVTLHVGGGTFLPVKVEDTKDHVMHSEWCSVSEETVRTIAETKAAGGRIVAVGTTALRALESAARNGKLMSFVGDTDIFITPGYRFKVVDVLMTNFHLPKSTLFMLVCAFSGTQRMKEAYAHAIEKGYRFYSYGDACLLERCEETA